VPRAGRHLVADRRLCSTLTVTLAFTAGAEAAVGEEVEALLSS